MVDEFVAALAIAAALVQAQPLHLSGGPHSSHIHLELVLLHQAVFLLGRISEQLQHL